MSLKRGCLLPLLSVLLVLAASASASAQSRYTQLDRDVRVSARAEVLSLEVAVSAQADLLVSTDGRFFPAGGTAGDVYVTVDGARVTNESVIDWAGSTNPQQHSFNAVGVATLAPGKHRVALVGDPVGGPFSIGAAANLAAMVRPAGTASAVALGADRGPFAFETAGLQVGSPAPSAPLVTADVGAGDLVALASGDAFRDGHAGDAMLGISLDGRTLGNSNAMWTVQDLCACAELRGPMFTHAFLSGLTGRHRVSLDASEFPWKQGEDPAHYRVHTGTRLVTLQGPMQVRGSAPTSSALNNWWDYVPIGTAQGWPGVPQVGTNVPLATAQLDVPAGHDGVVMFLAKSRVQGDPSDGGGTASLRLAVDGRFVGSVGVQQLAAPDGASQRTVSASYLAAGNQALAPGRHTVTVYGRADGQFKHLVMVKDLNLIWFDEANPPAQTAPGPPPPAPPPRCSRARAVGRAHDRYGTYALSVPRTCPPGRRFVARITWKRRKGELGDSLQLRKVAFRLGSGPARTDRRRPFSQVLRAPRSRCAAPVRVRLARRAGRKDLRPISIRVRIRTCR